MTASSIQDKVKKIITKLVTVCFWLAVWEVIYLAVKQEILIVSPAQVFSRLSELVVTSEFWETTAKTLLRIMAGYISAVIFGTLLAFLTHFVPFTKQLFKPLIVMTRATPVASFIILALVWLTKNTVPVFISSIMVFPIIWGNVSEGLNNTSKEMLDMSTIFNVSKVKQLYSVYIPSAFPYFLAGCTTALGLAWKAGIAAEVIATPRSSIGLQLNNSKVYLETVDLFSWTFVIIILSLILEKVIAFLLKKAIEKRKRTEVKDEH
ncbi:MAG: ABC transporter permease subunit [Clostridiales bacterium]|nr:ABC transporter permease subunit [Clostridiales bacterium]